MTLDCEPFGFFQPRVITLHSYYLTSLVNLSFYGLTFHPIFSFLFTFLCRISFRRLPVSGMVLRVESLTVWFVCSSDTGFLDWLACVTYYFLLQNTLSNNDAQFCRFILGYPFGQPATAFV